MGKNSAIEWCDHSFSPWYGCTKVSDGCDHCYAEAWAARYNKAVWGGERTPASESTWQQPQKWNREAAKLGIRYKVFCAELADVFDNQAPARERDRLWKLICCTPNLDWQILTKRPQNIRKMLPDDWGDGYPNVWLGVTAENQVECNRRIPILQQIPAVIRFLSCEPLLDGINLDLCGIHWLICGGESGPGRRSVDLRWARALRDQCRADGIAFFMKQVDKVLPIPPDLFIREYPDRRPAQRAAPL